MFNMRKETSEIVFILRAFYAFKGRNEMSADDISVFLAA